MNKFTDGEDVLKVERLGLNSRIWPIIDNTMGQVDVSAVR